MYPDDGAEWKAMDLGQRFAVHLPREEHLVDFYLAPGHRDGVVVHLALLEVGVCAEELEMVFRPMDP